MHKEVAEMDEHEAVVGESAVLSLPNEREAEGSFVERGTSLSSSSRYKSGCHNIYSCRPSCRPDGPSLSSHGNGGQKVERETPVPRRKQGTENGDLEFGMRAIG